MNMLGLEKMRNVVVIMVLLFSFVTAQAQEYGRAAKNEVVVSEARVSRDERELVVDYEIMLGDNVLSCEVEVVLKADGRSVRYNPNDLIGDYGRITSSGQKQVRFNVENMKHALAGRAITFTLNVKSKDVLDNTVLAMASVSLFPQPSYGLMLGYVRKIGGYAKVRSDFGSVKPAYGCMSDGTMDGGYFWASGEQKKARLQATAGMLFRASRNVYPYAGVGYGARGVYWEDFKGEWAQVEDYSCKGIAAEAGLIFKFGPVAFSAGVSSTAFKYVEAEIGIGVAF